MFYKYYLFMALILLPVKSVHPNALSNTQHLIKESIEHNNLEVFTAFYDARSLTKNERAILAQYCRNLLRQAEDTHKKHSRTTKKFISSLHKTTFYGIIAFGGAMGLALSLRDIFDSFYTLPANDFYAMSKFVGSYAALLLGMLAYIDKQAESQQYLEKLTASSCTDHTETIKSIIEIIENT